MKPLPKILTAAEWSSAKKRAKFTSKTGFGKLLQQVDSSYNAVDWKFCSDVKKVNAIRQSPQALKKKTESISAAKLDLEDALNALIKAAEKWDGQDAIIAHHIKAMGVAAKSFRNDVQNDKTAAVLEAQIDAFIAQARDLATRRVKAKKALGEVIKGNLDQIATGSVEPVLNPLRDYFISITAIHKMTPEMYKSDFVKVTQIWGSNKSPLYELSKVPENKKAATREKLIKAAMAYLHAINDNDPITKI